MKYPQVVSMPSAVSNWLDEQLESRGIDAVVYTRYILSLLHSHTVDVLYPEEDLQFSHSKKEVRRSNRGFVGSHRSSSDWWRHAHADAERIKRSAAVECLLSASEQNCEIESLVDELCEKLKEVNSESAYSPAGDQLITDSAETKETKKITPQELAEKYYAAFPPLCPRSPLTESKLLTLIPKWRNVTTSSSTTTSPVKKKAAKKVGKQLWCYGNQSRVKESNENMMKARSQNKQRFNCLGRSKNNFRNTTNTLNNWDFNFFTNNKKLTSLKNKEDQIEVQDSLDQCVDISKDIWNNEEENMYEDLPVDIKDLLDSPTPHDHTVEMMNIANMRDTGKRRFIPYGTNIMGSIWSTEQDINYDNNFNSAVDSSSASNEALDFKFSTISIDNPKFDFDDWPPANSAAENETNALFEEKKMKKKCRRSLFLDGFHSLPGDWYGVVREQKDKQGEDNNECFENEKLMNHLTFSLMKLNHDKEKSCFAEVAPRSVVPSQPYNPFGKPQNHTFSFNSKFMYSDVSDKEDLLTSDRTHFKPIREHTDNGLGQHSKYADGTTFFISNTLEKVDYKRSESGSLLVENEFGHSKKYFKYSAGNIAISPDPEFVLKFSICQNDKSAQTEESKLDFESLVNYKFDSLMNVCVTPDTDELQECFSCSCDISIISASSKDNSVPSTRQAPIARPESVLSEVVWKYEKNKKCEKCNENKNSAWSRGDWASAKGQTDSDWDENGLRSIWSGSEVCQKCLALNEPEQPRPAPNDQLREDISIDGEQLLSDLSSLQKSYMDDLPLAAERSLDISDLIATSTTSGGASKERKRRHSLIVDSWSFASRLEEDCLMQMATLPALRAVTL